MGSYWSQTVKPEDIWKRLSPNKTEESVYSIYPGTALKIVNDPHNAFFVLMNETQDHIIALKSNDSWYIIRLVEGGLLETSECPDFLKLLIKEVSPTKTFTIKSCTLADHRLYKLLASIDTLTVYTLINI